LLSTLVAVSVGCPLALVGGRKAAYYLGGSSVALGILFLGLAFLALVADLGHTAFAFYLDHWGGGLPSIIAGLITCTLGWLCGGLPSINQSSSDSEPRAEA
jgi:hypothetical protein